MTKVRLFRPRRSTFRLGLSLLVFATSLPVVCGIGTFVENANRMVFWPRLLQSLSCVAMWSPVILASVWLILSYSRSRLLIGTKSVGFRSVSRTRRICFQEILRAKWNYACDVRLRTARGRQTLGISDFIKKHQAAELLHERIEQGVQEGWLAVERSLDSIRKKPDLRQYNQFHLRLLWLLVLGPVLGIIAGLALYCFYGHQPELGWKGNFLLYFPVAGLGASLLLLVMGIWLWWMDMPEEFEVTPTERQ